jgi:hypothetical protein
MNEVLNRASWRAEESMLPRIASQYKLLDCTWDSAFAKQAQGLLPL